MNIPGYEENCVFELASDELDELSAAMPTIHKTKDQLNGPLAQDGSQVP